MGRYHAGAVITREDQFKLIEAAERNVMAKAKAASVPLHCVQFVVPFVATDFSLRVWLFVETDAQLRCSEIETWSAWLKGEFLSVLRAQGYPERWLGEVNFVFDSHENVVKNLEGNYFYRVR